MVKLEELAMARQSMVEELQAINSYQSRIVAAADQELKRILQHNMDEEKEHTAMLMEWLRKNDPVQNSAFEKHD
jgi:hypothetical protein